METGPRPAGLLLVVAFVAAASPVFLNAQWRGIDVQGLGAPALMDEWARLEASVGSFSEGRQPSGPETEPSLWKRSSEQAIGPQAAGGAGGIALSTILSAVLPGAGQHVIGQDRRWIYLGLEAVGWFAYVNRRSAGADATHAYRDFAWDRARLQAEPRMDGDFDYYETLSKWQHSGAFDQDLGRVGVQPEVDVATFNGSIWSLASSLFLGGMSGASPSDPQYVRAIAYYQERAYDSAYLWEWRGTGADQDTYGSLITDSDEKYRQATNVLGAIIANHVVSVVDAFVSARGIVRGTQSEVVPIFTTEGTRWHTRVRVPTRW
jgi:hypothetical protein